MKRGFVGAVLLLTGVALAGAQGDGFDPEQLAMVYHQLTSEPLDTRRVAESSDAVRRASSFDRPEATATESSRLQAALAAADPATEFVTRVNDNIGPYDHDLGQFTVTLFTPGYYLPVQAFGQQYQVVFANADAARVIPMPRDAARDLDARLDATGRQVLDEVRFRVTGGGDPAGGVTGARVVRAELLSVRILDRSGNELYVPDLAAAAAAAEAARNSFDLAGADVAGFRVGVRAADLEATLTRLFGKVTRSESVSNAPPGVTASLTVNEMGCDTYIGMRNRGDVGNVCVTALLDGGNVVRAITVQRVFGFFQEEVFRAAMIQRFGPVAHARSSGGFIMAWGPEVGAPYVYRESPVRNALSARFEPFQDALGRSGNALPRIRVVLHLVDAEWAVRQGP